MRFTLIKRVTTQGRGNRLLPASYLRWRPRCRFGLFVGNSVLVALARAWSVTTLSVILLSAAISLAPMWDRAIFVKSLFEALNTDPEMLQLAFAVTEAAPADQAGRAPGSLNDSDREGR